MRLRHIKGCEQFIADSRFCFSGEEVLLKKGRWKEVYGNSQPLHIEIGMGKGQFIRSAAEKHKEINFLGIEKYQTVLMKALQRRERREEEIGAYANLYFACFDAKELCAVFEEGEVDKIYLNFSDPWPKERHASRRLTSPGFLGLYAKILKEGGSLEFKTDNADLFSYSLASISESGWEIVFKSFDLHREEKAKENIMSEYEEKFSQRGQKIHKLEALYRGGER